jgi:hypothetical protein
MGTDLFISLPRRGREINKSVPINRSGERRVRPIALSAEGWEDLAVAVLNLT